MHEAVRRTGSFLAVDHDGLERRIYIYTESVDAATRGDPNAEGEGLKELRTESGESVNRIEKGTYEIGRTGEVLHSDDPAAP